MKDPKTRDISYEHCRCEQRDRDWENSVIRLNNNDNDAFTTQASFWRILTSPAEPGNVQRRVCKLRRAEAVSEAYSS
jgi:hypothetical protein